MNCQYPNFGMVNPVPYPIYQQPQYTYPQIQQPTQPQNPFTQEQSYIENILRLNRGKQATIYMNFETGSPNGNMIFKGTIEAAGKDHIILSDKNTGTRYMLLTIYLLYITFDEEINYYYPYTSEYNITTTSKME